MIADSRLARLSPAHHHFVWTPDPWHYQAFRDNGAVVAALAEGRMYQAPGCDGIHGGPWTKLWYSADRQGRLIGEWGLDIPPGVKVCSRCNGPNINGVIDWCSYCGIPYPQ